MEHQSHCEPVNADAEACYAAVTDFERYPDWFANITKATVLERDDANDRWLVEFELNMIVKTIRYVLQYQGERPNKLIWKMTEGDVTGVEGSYTFTKLDDKVCEAECAQSVDVGFYIPGPIKRTIERSALADSVREFKKAVEERGA